MKAWTVSPPCGRRAASLGQPWDADRREGVRAYLTDTDFLIDEKLEEAVISELGGLECFSQV